MTTENIAQLSPCALSRTVAFYQSVSDDMAKDGFALPTGSVATLLALKAETDRRELLAYLAAAPSAPRKSTRV